MKTCVIQSYRTTDVPTWIDVCMTSVLNWCDLQRYEYRFIDDEIFDRVPDWYREKTTKHPQIATDLGRLCLIQEALREGYERAIWLDADVLVFNPDRFNVTVSSGFAFGREIWVQADKQGKPRAFRNVHNAYAVFCSDNRFLTFYQYACEQIISHMEIGANKGMAPQIVGPKFLTSLHNTLGFDLTHDIAMLSPDVLRDIESGGGPSLDLLHTQTKHSPAGANLCASLTDRSDKEGNMLMHQVCDVLLSHAGIPTSDASPEHS